MTSPPILVTGDLATGQGLSAAVQQAGTIVRCVRPGTTWG
jgi:hypothetical protein